jgi:type II secretory pathway predicted ATPase ExeA
MDLKPHYCAYWGLSKPPFDSVPDPKMYFDLHRSVDNAVSEMLFAIEERNECLAVIIGDVGPGKTIALRVVLDSLEQEYYRMAFIANPDTTFIQLLKEIVAQLSGVLCTGNRHERVLEVFNKLLLRQKQKERRS